MSKENLQKEKEDLKSMFDNKESLIYWIKEFARENNLNHSEIGFLLLDI